MPHRAQLHRDAIRRSGTAGGAPAPTTTVLQRIDLLGPNSEPPANPAWSVNQPAGVVTDANNGDIKVVEQSHLVEEGRGFSLLTSATGARIRTTWVYRGDGVAAANDWLPKWYSSEFPDGGFPTAMAAVATAWGVLAVRPDANFVYVTQILTFAALGWVASREYNVEQTRDRANVLDDYLASIFWRRTVIEELTA